LTKTTDPSDALKSFQQALVDGQIQLQRGQIDPGLFVHLDQPNGQPTFTYVRLQRQTVTALVILVVSDPIEGQEAALMPASMAAGPVSLVVQPAQFEILL